MIMLWDEKRSRAGRRETADAKSVGGEDGRVQQPAGGYNSKEG